MASKKQTAAAAPDEASSVPDGQVVVYPTHKRGAGPLEVALPAVDGESGLLSIDDAGAAVPDAIAAFLVAGGEATLEKPEA